MSWLSNLLCQHEWRSQYEMADGRVMVYPDRVRADYRVYRCLKCPKIVRKKFWEPKYPPKPPETK